MEAVPITTGKAQLSRSSPKVSLLKYHRWFAAMACLFLLMQGISGSMLVFRDNIEPILHPELKVETSGEAASPQQLVDRVGAELPQYGINRVEFPERADRAVLFKLSGTNGEGDFIAAVDPYRNMIVRQGSVANWPIEWLLQWHEQMRMGEAGETIIGIVGLTLLFFALSGLIVWWPTAGRFSSGFRIAKGGGATTWRTTHRVVGAICAVILIFSAATGSMMVFKDSIRDMLRHAGPVASKPSAEVSEQPGRVLVSIDHLVEHAQAEIGASPLRQLRFADNEGRGVSIYLDAKENGIGAITSFVAYDRYTGKELGRYVSGELPASNAAIDFLYPLHTGKAGGTLLKLVLLMAAISLIFLSISGPALWLHRAGKTAKRQRTRER